MADNELQHTLDMILSELTSDDPDRCIAAMNELGTLNASSAAILKVLENLAIHGTREDVRRIAKELLTSRVHQFVRRNTNKLNVQDRSILLKQIEQWETDGLLEPERAEIIKQRYNFDQITSPAQSQSIKDNQQRTILIKKEIPTEAASPRPATPEQPRPTLMQTLLSESSVKVYLYLGAFFVIASALILAAVVEAARLPILLVATIAFGGGAFVIRKRLLQPSFTLFIVFSFLLPIDANVLKETIGFLEPVLSMYWIIVFLLMALIWGFSTWLYESKFFSIVAFVSLSLVFYRATQVFDTEAELQIFFGMLASLAGLAGTYLLKKWKDSRFALPVFLVAQLQVVLLLSISFVLATIHTLDSDLPTTWWLLIALTWIAAASFFAASDVLIPFVLFPWMAVASLLPIPWFFLSAFHVTWPVYAVGFWLWGTAFALMSEIAFKLKFETFEKYQRVFLIGSLPLFITSILIALNWEKPPWTFALLTGTALVYSTLHGLRPRWYVWSVALLYALSAYFVLFTLPVIEKLNVSFLYQMLGASILLTLPELFIRTPLTKESLSRMPAILLGLFLSLFSVAMALLDTTHTGRSAIVFLAFAILLTLYAFHFNRPWIAYFAGAAETLMIVYGLHHVDLDLWLPALTLLSVLYYAAGFFLRRLNSTFKEWADTLVNSGLGLGVLLSLVAIVLSKETAGWYMLVIAVLFAVDLFARSWKWFELVVEVLLSLSLYMILDDLNSPFAFEHFLFGASLIWLGGDLLFGRFVEERSHRPVTLGIGYLFLLASSVILLASANENLSTIYFTFYALFFVIYAFIQNDPRLGYFVTTYIPLATIKLWNGLNWEKWIFPLIVFAVSYYAIGFFLRRNQIAKGWDRTLLYSGMGLGVLTSVAAPFQGGLESSIPVAIAGTLFAVEAFALRNVWWAIPADALYLMSYFMILAELNVEEPQYYSIGAALLGMLMHYLLTRAGSKTGAFIAGMLSQLILLGTTYIQMVSNNDLKFFFVLFAQSMVILIYGLILRSRSLVITPIAFAVLGVITVVYSALKGLSSVILIGCTGVILLMLGIGAVILRERITKLGEQLSDWKP